MPNIELTAKCVLNIDPHERNRITVGMQMTDAQIYVAIDTLLDAGGPERRTQLMAQLAQDALEGSHA